MAVSTLCIVGLGLIGGGVGLAARRLRAVARVVGVTARAQTLEKAKAMGAIDEGTLDPRAGAAEADLIVITTPGRLQQEIARVILPACRPDAILTDAASTKAAHVEALERMIADGNHKVRFVGSHPLAGSEKSGIDAAPLLQLDGAWCLLTPTPRTDADACETVESFWRALGMRTRRLSPDEHDEILARSSHLPHLTAAVLIGRQDEQSLTLSGTGLRDMTRLAGGDPDLWTDICMKNPRPVARALRECGEELKRLAGTIETFARPGTPEAEAARERLFRRLADARRQHERYRELWAKRAAPPDGES